MKVDVETFIVHDGEKWIAKNDTLSASGHSLNELDDDMKRSLQQCGKFEKGSKVKVFMGFDYSTIPTWIRQYASHYFNRCVTIQL